MKQNWRLSTKVSKKLNSNNSIQLDELAELNSVLQTLVEDNDDQSQGDYSAQIAENIGTTPGQN